MASRDVFTLMVIRVIAILFLMCMDFVKTANINFNQKDQSSEKNNEFENKATIVLAATIPAGLVIGGLWCYCMSTVCKTRQSDYKQLRLSAPAQRHHLVQSHYPPMTRREYSLDPPTLSDLSSCSPSPLP